MKTKMSIDFTEENRKMLEAIKKKKGISYSKAVNDSIDLLYRMPPSICHKFLTFVKNELYKIISAKDVTGDIEDANLFIEQSYLEKFGRFINNGDALLIDKPKSKIKYSTEEMASGKVLIYPSEEFILLNPESANKCSFATVTEVKNAPFFVPHFIRFFVRPFETFSDRDKQSTEQLCVEKWPRFKEIMESVIEPILGENDKIINTNAVYSSPQIGHFPIYEKGDPRFPLNYQPPLGMMIVDKSFLD